MSEKRLIERSKAFLNRHRGHKLEVPPSADRFVFHLWCETCEDKQEKKVKGKVPVNRRSSIVGQI